MEIAIPLQSIASHLEGQLSQKHPAIKAVRIYRHHEHDGLILFLSVQPWPAPEELVDRLASIARTADLLLPIHSVQVNEGRPIPVAMMQRLEPTQWKEAPSDLDYKNLAAKLDSAMALALNMRTLIEVSKAGIYLACKVRHGGQPPGVPPLSEDEMLGQPVSAIAGQEAHERIVAAVNKAIDSGKPLDIFYSAQFRGENFRRFFQGTCTPKADATGAWLWIARIPFEELSGGAADT